MPDSYALMQFNSESDDIKAKRASAMQYLRNRKMSVLYDGFTPTKSTTPIDWNKHANTIS